MAISSVSSSTAVQAVRPPQDAAKVTAAPPAKSENDNNNATKAAEVSPPKPSVNTSGQTVGTLVNVTA